MTDSVRHARHPCSGAGAMVTVGVPHWGLGAQRRNGSLRGTANVSEPASASQMAKRTPDTNHEASAGANEAEPATSEAITGTPLHASCAQGQP